MRRPFYAVTSYEYAGDVTVPPAVGSVELRGPYDVTGPGESPSRAARCSPAIRRERPVRAADPVDDRPPRVQAAGRRSRHRPADDASIAPVTIADVAAQARRRAARRGFDAGIEAALRRILVSPDFLFRVEQDPAGATARRTRTASATSSWRRGCRSSSGAAFPTMSCSTLRRADELRQPAVLEQQVRRMLADPRSRALVDELRRPVAVAAQHPAASRRIPRVFPDFDENLREALASARPSCSSTARSARIAASPSC